MSNPASAAVLADDSATNVQKAQYVTPPSSFISPPTPPPTDDRLTQTERIIAYLKDIQSGHRKLCGTQSWIQFSLAEGEFDELERRLKSDPDLHGYVQDKVRFDYDNQTRLFVIRMPSVIHETFRKALQQEIWAWITQLGSREDHVGAFARGMAFLEGARSYKFPPSTTPVHKSSNEATVAQATRQPDIPFRHKKDALPGTIVEVAYTQPFKDLRRLAYTYLVYSNAAVQVVFGFDLKPGSTQSATFSVWRSKDEDDELSMVTDHFREEFRDANGKPTGHDPIVFRLSNFAMDETAREILGDEDEELSITMEELCGFLSTAEEEEEVTQTGALRSKGTGAGKRRLPLEETPERTISLEEDEEWEARSAKRASKGDRTYSGPCEVTTGLPRRRSARLGDPSSDPA